MTVVGWFLYPILAAAGAQVAKYAVETGKYDVTPLATQIAAAIMAILLAHVPALQPYAPVAQPELSAAIAAILAPVAHDVAGILKRLHDRIVAVPPH